MLKTRCSLIKGFVYGIFKLKSKVQPFDHIFSAVLLLVIVAVSTQSSLSHRKLPIGYNAFPLPTLSYFVYFKHLSMLWTSFELFQVKHDDVWWRWHRV
ncbi:uncharacterized protein LOC111907851 isoform X2 [Lactuca sativa]|uniref:uncharacterized protein LOC111907851 isoform X2 n=1 Tax=Lactuca sativa TaxID=4236 RepID=UPI001C6920C9|nr:uncharacterized protein LOC111907851 isoform X2 [Lactuca sativa]